MRPLDQFGPAAIPGTEGGSVPFFSPDGRSVGFYANGTLQRVSVDGGRPLEICATPAVSSATWGTDDTIVFATPVGMWRVPARGTTPERLTTVDAAAGELQHAYPRPLQNGEVLFGVTTDRGWHLAILSLASKQVRALGQAGSGGAGAQYIPQTGHLLYATSGGLVASSFDPSSGSGPGAPVPLLERPEVDPSGSTAFAVSTSGTLAYIPRESTLPSRALVLVDRTGRPTVLSEKPDAFAHPRLSPDGHRLAVAIESDNGSDIWIYDVDHGTPTPLVTGGVNRFPIWSADGQQITFQSARLGGVSLYSQRVNGTFEPEALIRSTSDQSQSLSRALAGLLPGTMPIFTNANPHLPMSWARDGLTLAFEERKPGADHDIWVLTRGSEPWAFQRTENDESSPVFSPDGKWLAYVSDESGRRSVWVQPFPGPGAKWLVSPDGGTEPAWSRDGTTLFFRRANQLVSVPITPGAEFRWGRPQRVLEFRYATLAGARNYDVSPDNTFVVVRSEGAADADQFNVVLNWFAELRSRK
jgi:serine/threonine-protein kinase